MEIYHPRKKRTRMDLLATRFKSRRTLIRNRTVKGEHKYLKIRRNLQYEIWEYLKSSKNKMKNRRFPIKNTRKKVRKETLRSGSLKN